MKQLQSLIDSKKRAEVKKALAEGRLESLLAKKKPQIELIRSDPVQAPEKKLLTFEEQSKTDYDLLVAANAGDKRRVLELIAKGADVNAKHKKWGTSLMVAVKDRHVEIAELLIDNGADVNLKFGESWTSLMYAVDNGDDSMIQMLISKGADVNATSNHDLSPLMIAAKDRDISAIEILIAEGADVNAKDDTGRTALLFAADSKRTVDLLKQHGATE